MSFFRFLFQLCFSQSGPAAHFLQFQVDYANTEDADRHQKNVRIYNVNLENKHSCFNLYDTVLKSNLITDKSLDVTKDIWVRYIWIYTKERYTPSYYDNLWIGPTELRGRLLT